MELSRSTIGSYQPHEAVRRVHRLSALADAIFMAVSITAFLAAVYGAGFVHGLVYAGEVDAWADQVVAQ